MESAFDHQLVVSVYGATESEDGERRLNHIHHKSLVPFQDKLPIIHYEHHLFLALTFFTVSFSGIYTGVYTEPITFQNRLSAAGDGRLRYINI